MTMVNGKLEAILLSQETMDEILRLNELKIPMKYIGRVVGVTAWYVKRTLKENDLYVNKYVRRSESIQNKKLKKKEEEQSDESMGSL